jgi:predicted acyltransferase
MNVSKSERLISLDVFRGITIAGMVLVNNPGTWSHIYPALRHAEWHGCTPTDLIFPFFLFIVGVAITFALTKRKQEGADQKHIIGKIVKRSIILFGLGLILNGFPYFDLSSIRIPGVLQRIAIVYLVSSIIFLRTNIKTQAIIGALFLLIYWGLMTLVPVPGVGDPNLQPTTNLAAWLDNLLLGGHLWSSTKVWDPEGILSTIPAIATGLSGVLTGHLLKSDLSKERKTVWLFFAGAVSIVIGYVWDMWFPINKSIWTSSYVMYTSGLALQFLAFSYWLIDVQKIKWWAKPFQVYGMNAITLFFGSSLVAKLLYTIKVTGESGEPIALKAYLFQNLFASWLQPINASLIWALIYVLIWLGLMWILYAKKIFIKV